MSLCFEVMDTSESDCPNANCVISKKIIILIVLIIDVLVNDHWQVICNIQNFIF